MSEQISQFRNNIIEAGVLDPEGTHHEFVSGMHGRKLDFDTIPTGSNLYSEWTQVAADFIVENFETSPAVPTVIVGVANGTNRVALDTARRFEGRAIGLVSEKDRDDSKVLRLTRIAHKTIHLLRPQLVIVLEDVGTTGSNSVQVAKGVQEAGAQSVAVVTTWKRRERLERLEEANISYQAIIDEPLTTYSPEDCQQTGFCSEGWDFIPREK
jgi:orotate phosphoribosyltransferase